MKYAMPFHDGKIFNHYSKAPQFLVIDDVTNQSHCVDIITQSNEASCGKKSKILAVLKDNDVNAVIVKNIGEAMLTSLFQQGIKVFTTIRGMNIDNLDFNQLVPVEDLSFARPSVNKKNKEHTCCKGSHSHQFENKLAPNRNRLGDKTLSKLQRVHKLHH